MAGSDFVKEVTPDAAFDWDKDDSQSSEWTVVTGESDGQEVFKKLPTFAPLHRCL
jgi:carbamoyl-phosphate synthase small subunit